MILLHRNHYPLKKLPPLTFVEEFEFSTLLPLEDCYTKLAMAFNKRSDKQLIQITEVLWDGKDVYFSAERVHKYERFAGHAGLRGRLILGDSDGKVVAQCYLGCINDLFMTCFVIVSFCTIFFNEFNSGRNILVASALSCVVPAMYIFAEKKLSAEAVSELKYYSTELFAENATHRKYPFKL